jgi:hypothetical protein
MWEVASNLCVRGSAPAERDDVVGDESVGTQTVEESQREVFVQEDVHDAMRTAGGRWAATCAA